MEIEYFPDGQYPKPVPVKNTKGLFIKNDMYSPSSDKIPDAALFSILDTNTVSK